MLTYSAKHNKQSSVNILWRGENKRRWLIALATYSSSSILGVVLIMSAKFYIFRYRRANKHKPIHMMASDEGAGTSLTLKEILASIASYMVEPSKNNPENKPSFPVKVKVSLPTECAVKFKVANKISASFRGVKALTNLSISNRTQNP